MSKVKKMKVKNPDGNFSEYINIGADAANVDLASGDTVESKITEMDSTVNNLSTVATSGDYTDLLNKPTKLSEFSNDKNFIDNTVKNLTNYYDKTTLDGMLAAISTLDIQTITDFPESPSKTTIYLKKKDTEGSQNIYDEYLYVNDSWEKIGDTEIDLSNYYNKEETENLINKSNDIPVLEFVLPDDVTGGQEEYVVPEDLDEVFTDGFHRSLFTRHFSSSGQEKIKNFIDSFGTEDFENKQCIIKLQIKTKLGSGSILTISLLNSYCKRKGTLFSIDAQQNLREINFTQREQFVQDAYAWLLKNYSESSVANVLNFCIEFNLNIDNLNDLANTTVGENDGVTMSIPVWTLREQKTPLIIDFSDLMQMGKQKSIYEWVASYFNISEQEAYCGLHSTTQPAKYRFFLSGRRMQLENFYIQENSYEDRTEYLHATSFDTDNSTTGPLRFLDSMAKIAQNTNYVDVDELLMNGNSGDLMLYNTWEFQEGDWDYIKSGNMFLTGADSIPLSLKNFGDYIVENKPKYMKLVFPTKITGYEELENINYLTFYTDVSYIAKSDDLGIIGLKLESHPMQTDDFSADIIYNIMIQTNNSFDSLLGLLILKSSYAPYNIEPNDIGGGDKLYNGPLALLAEKTTDEQTAQAASERNPNVLYYWTE